MRKNNVYIILRELDNWEENEEAKEACLKVIHILIADEPHPSRQNLKEVNIPADIKFDDELETSSKNDQQ